MFEKYNTGYLSIKKPEQIYVIIIIIIKDIRPKKINNKTLKKMELHIKL